MARDHKRLLDAGLLDNFLYGEKRSRVFAAFRMKAIGAILNAPAKRRRSNNSDCMHGVTSEVESLAEWVRLNTRGLNEVYGIQDLPHCLSGRSRTARQKDVDGLHREIFEEILKELTNSYDLYWLDDGWVLAENVCIEYRRAARERRAEFRNQGHRSRNVMRRNRRNGRPAVATTGGFTTI